MSPDAGNFATLLNSAWVSDDLNLITIPENADASTYTWVVVKADGADEYWVLQNVSTGKYLTYRNGSLSMVDQVSDACYWSLKVRDVVEDRGAQYGVSEVTTLTPMNSGSSYIRYSVGGGKIKIGSTDVTTDTANSDISLYEKGGSAVVPTPTPTPTPDVTPEPTPTPDVTPEPTPTPDVTPEPTPTPDPVEPLPYEDVVEDDWFYDAVAYTYYEKVMTGMDETHFGPYSQLSRAQFALILYRIEGEPAFETEKSFVDIVGDEWYGAAVLWAAEAGIVNGYESGCFGPADQITREQMAVMMYRYAGYLKNDTTNDGDYSSFLDASLVSGFAEDAMKWAYAKQIITGKENGTKLDPQGNTARAEAAAIIQRFMK